MNLNRYTSGLKKDEAYRQGIEDALQTLSENLQIPYNELHLGLFFSKGTAAKGVLILKGEMSQKELEAIRKQWKSQVKL